LKKLIIALVVAAASAAIIVPLAGASNSDAAHACQQGGWQHLYRGDLSAFANQSDCVSYAANGGTLYSGFENFSEMSAWSAGATQDQTPAPDQPTWWKGGTIDSGYGATPIWWFPAGGILAAGPYFNGFASGSHFLFTGLGQQTARFTLTTPAKSVQVQAESDKTGITPTLTLTGYDASNHVVATAMDTHPSTGVDSATLKITSSSSNIKSFTVTNDDGGNNAGLGVSNILWG
jgi:type II secretory pathway pseudopilin PulG